MNSKCDGCRWSNIIGGLCDECARAFKDRYESNHKKKTDDDAVSRRMAIDVVKKHYRAHDNDLLELIAFDIEQLPSAQLLVEIASPDKIKDEKPKFFPERWSEIL